MGILSAVVQTLMAAMFDIGHDGALGGAIRPQLVGYEAFGSIALFSQQPCQQAFGGLASRRT